MAFLIPIPIPIPLSTHPPLHNPLTSPHHPPKPSHPTTPPTSLHNNPSNPQNPNLHTNTLKAFEAFTWRAQQNLCQATALADGLGTFTPLPQTYSHPPTLPSTTPPKKHTTRSLQGGRAFKRAIITVWRANSPHHSRQRHATVLNYRTGEVKYVTNAAGISIKIEPRAVEAPELRADVSYFEVGDVGGVGWGAWWFSGGVDVCKGGLGHGVGVNGFMGDLGVLQRGWRRLCLESGDGEREGGGGREEINRFLECCLVEEGGGWGVEDVLRRARAFGFMSKVVEELLPVYLPIVRSRAEKDEFRPGDSGGKGRVGRRDLGRDSRFSVGGRRNLSELFKMDGGARLESTFVNSSPLGLWRFNLTPPLRSPPGRVLQRLRNRRGSTDPFMYL